MLKIRNIFEKLPSVHGTKAADLFLSAIYSAANRSNSFFPSIVESENGYSLCINLSRTFSHFKFHIFFLTTFII